MLQQLVRQQGGMRQLAHSTGRDTWPQHGVYFFYDNGERRADGSARIVRIGTHALTPRSQTSLWTRLSQHRGNLTGTNPGGGNHRTSIFRLHVGTALIQRDLHPPELLDSWLAKRVDPRWAQAERELERQVSSVIGALPFTWLAVPTAPDGSSHRGYIEHNAIALLAQHNRLTGAASASWLGLHAHNADVRGSGLWNVNHSTSATTPPS